MLRIPCPHCGVRDHPEFSYGGDASKPRPDTGAPVPDDDWVGYLFFRPNPAGRHVEYWHHTHGCRRWLVVTRHTGDNSIIAVEWARQPGGNRPPGGRR